MWAHPYTYQQPYQQAYPQNGYAYGQQGYAQGNSQNPFQQIVDSLLAGRTNKEIARKLNLSEKTIKHYMTNLMIKLGAKNRLEVVLAVQAGGRSPLGETIGLP